MGLQGTLGFSGMLYITGTASGIALIILLLLSQKPFEYPYESLIYEKQQTFPFSNDLDLKN